VIRACGQSVPEGAVLRPVCLPHEPERLRYPLAVFRVGAPEVLDLTALDLGIDAAHVACEVGDEPFARAVRVARS
jgi:hypothetical protein